MRVPAGRPDASHLAGGLAVFWLNRRLTETKPRSPGSGDPFAPRTHAANAESAATRNSVPIF